MGDDVLDKVDSRDVSEVHGLGACLIWRAGEPLTRDGKYGRLYDPAQKRTDSAHVVVYVRVYGPIPTYTLPDGKVVKMTVDHLCWQTLCQRPDHFEAITREENTRRMRARRKARKTA